MEQSKKEAERRKELYDKNLIARESFDQMVAVYDGSVAVYDSSKEKLNAARSKKDAAVGQLNAAVSQLNSSRAMLKESEANIPGHTGGSENIFAPADEGYAGGRRGGEGRKV